MLEGVTRNNLEHVDVKFPLGALTSVTGVSGSGKSSLVSQALVELVSAQLGGATEAEEEDGGSLDQDEIIETITHMAFYSGWPSAVSSLAIAKEVFQKK